MNRSNLGRWAVCAVALAGCATTTRAADSPSTVSSTPTRVTTPEAATTRTLTGEQWQAMRDGGDFTVVDVENVGERVEVQMGAEVPPPPAGTVRVTECMPGGSSDGLVRERATGALWRLRTQGGMTVPPGVMISATRCFRRDVPLAAGDHIVGTMIVSYGRAAR